MKRSASIICATVLTLLPASSEASWCKIFPEFVTENQTRDGSGCNPKVVEVCSEGLLDPVDSLDYFRRWRVGQKHSWPECLLVNAEQLDEKFSFLFLFSLSDKLKTVEGKKPSTLSEGTRKNFLMALREARMSWMHNERYLHYLLYYSHFIDRKWGVMDLVDVKNAISHPEFSENYCFVQYDVPWESVSFVVSAENYKKCIEKTEN